MSDIKFNCPQCGQHLAVDATGAGTTVACPKCGQAILIPQLARPARQEPPRQAKRWWLPLAGIAALALIAGFLVWQTPWRKTTAAGPASAPLTDQAASSKPAANPRAAKESNLPAVQTAPVKSAPVNIEVFALHQAAYEGNLGEVKALIAKGADVNAKWPTNANTTPLFIAVSKGHEDMRGLFDTPGFKKINEVKDRTKNVDYPRQYAEIVSLLLANGADINAKDSYNRTPLQLAVRFGCSDMARLLIAKGADVNAKDNEGATPLFSAALDNNKDMENLLLNKGAEVDIFTASAMGDIERVKGFLKNDPNAIDATQSIFTPFHAAAFSGQTDMMKFLIEKGANVNAGYPQKPTPLYWAAYKGHLDAAELLVNKGAIIKSESSNSPSPLFGAAWGGNREIGELLVAKGADVNAKDSSGWTPLFAAAMTEKGHKDMAELLIAKGADVNVKARDGHTPLWAAVRPNHLETARLLVSKGADINATCDKGGNTALNIAARFAQKDVVEFLLANGAEEHAAEDDGWTTLQYAALGGNKDIVEMLLARGADVNAKDNSGATPPVIAEGEGYPEIAELMREYQNKRVALPPEISAFIDRMEQQAGRIVEKRHLTLSAELKSFFAAARAGRLREANQIFVGLRRSADAGHSVAMDVEVAVGNFSEGDPELMLALARGLTNSLPPGCVYFGGTDFGRGLPTALCHSPGDPFFVITQNGLADESYLDYLGEMYGGKIYVPTHEDSEHSFQNYLEDAQKRLQSHQLKPGEDVKMKDGRVQVNGEVAVMTINGLLAKIIFDKNPDREFYYEESFPMLDFEPYLSPHGLLMKVNRQALNAIPSGEIQKDQDFWSGELADKIGDWLKKDTPVSNVCAVAEKVFANKDLSGFKGNPKFVNDTYTSRAYSKLRSSIAGIYAWRLSPQCPPEYRPQSDGGRQQLVEAADFAFSQAFALCPCNQEVVSRYANYLAQGGRVDDALRIAETARKCLSRAPQAPSSNQLDNLISQLSKAASSFNNANPLAAARMSHTATLLPDGKVLVAGGNKTNLAFLSGAELFNPGSGTWTATGGLTDARGLHTATLLPNGKVLVVGGLNSASNGPVSVELYDPADGTWTATGALTNAIVLHAAALLPDGKVLVAGGAGTNGNLSNAELYEPASGTWAVTGSMTTTRKGHTMTLLPSGKVLAAGGCLKGNTIPLASAEMYDPATGTWAMTGAMSEARALHTATLLSNGKVLVAGGFGTNRAVLASAELFDPASQKWTTTGSMTSPRVFQTATLLPNGSVLITGGDDRGNPLSSTELYDPSPGTWTPTASMAMARDYHTATLLPWGKVLIAGGRNNDDAINSVEIFDPSGRPAEQLKQ